MQLRNNLLEGEKPELMPAQGLSFYQGVAAINISMFAYVIGDTVTKLLGRSLPAIEIIFLRSAIIICALTIVMAVRRMPIKLQPLFSLPMLGRCFFDCVNILAFTTAVIHMHMAELYAISMIAPLLTTILAAIFLEEPIGWRRWLAVGFGFCGVLLVVKPDPYMLDGWALVAFLSALAGAMRETVTQKIGAGTPVIEVSFYSALFACFMSIVFGWNETWLPLEGKQYAIVCFQAMSWLVGAFMLIRACRLAPLPAVAPFRYMLLIWGSVSGYLVFDEIPDQSSLAGAAMIILCGLYTFHREAVRNRTVTSDVIPLS